MSWPRRRRTARELGPCAHAIVGDADVLPHSCPRVGLQTPRGMTLELRLLTAFVDGGTRISFTIVTASLIISYRSFCHGHSHALSVAVCSCEWRTNLKT